jgi:hypothetical protein
MANLSHAVYRKTAHTHLYLHSHSEHHLGHAQGCSVHRHALHWCCDGESLKEEIQHLKQAFKNNWKAVGSSSKPFTPRTNIRQQPRNCWGCLTFIPPFHIQLNKQAGVKGSWLGHTGVTLLLRGDIGGPRRALAILQVQQMWITASLCPRPSVHGEEPHPMRCEPVVQKTADLKE